MPSIILKNHVSVALILHSNWNLIQALYSSSSGFTPQYLQMNALLKEFPRSRFTVLGFPCNQFGHQEPGANSTEILNGMYYVRPGHGFKPHRNFKMMLKGDVNGANEHALFTYLKVLTVTG